MNGAAKGCRQGAAALVGALPADEHHAAAVTILARNMQVASTSTMDRELTRRGV